MEPRHHASHPCGKGAMLSSTATYALRAMLYVARHEAEGPVRVGDVATALDLPFLAPLPPVVFAAALAAWTLACIGLAWELVRRGSVDDRPLPAKME